MISIDRSHRDWSTPLPATTFCFENRFDKTKAHSIIQKIWNTANGTDYEYYQDFLSCLANANYQTIKICSKFATNESLKSLNLSELRYQVNFDLGKLKAAAFFSENIDVFETQTGVGTCYAFNSLMSHYFHYG